MLNNHNSWIVLDVITGPELQDAGHDNLGSQRTSTPKQKCKSWDWIVPFVLTFQIPNCISLSHATPDISNPAYLNELFTFSLKLASHFVYWLHRPLYFLGPRWGLHSLRHELLVTEGDFCEETTLLLVLPPLARIKWSSWAKYGKMLPLSPLYNERKILEYIWHIQIINMSHSHKYFYNHYKRIWVQDLLLQWEILKYV